MKRTLHTFESEVPREKIGQPGLDYQVLECEVGSHEAYAFIDRLIFARDIVYLEGQRGSLDFWKHDQSLWTELTSANIWATSEVSHDEARAIIEMLDRGEGFGSHIPTTTREWDAYALLETESAVQDAAI